MPKGRKQGDRTDDAMAAAEEIFINSSMSIEELAANSQELLGMQISSEILRIEARKRNWRLMRVRQTDPRQEIEEELEGLRRALYRQMIMAASDGLTLVGDFDRELVLERLEGVKGLDVKEGKQGGIDPAEINAYMNLLAKGNYEVRAARSGKTGLQQVLEMVEQEQEAFARREPKS